MLCEKAILGGFIRLCFFPIPTRLTHNLRFLSITSFLGSAEPSNLHIEGSALRGFFIFKLSFTFLRKPRWISEA